MGILDNILGRDEEPEAQRRTTASSTSSGNQSVENSADEQALARYRYMLRTAPPETIEQAHAEAFAKLTSEQRRMVLQQLNQSAPEAERAAKDDPQSLARAATRAEVRQPGTMERTFGSMGGGMGMGGMMAGSFLSSIAGVVVGSAIAQSFFGGSGFFGNEGDGGHDAGANDNQSAGDESMAETGGEMDAGDVGGDFGGDVGGDFGGGFDI